MSDLKRIMKSGFTVSNTVPMLNEKEEIFHQFLKYRKTVFLLCLGYAVDYSQAEELVQEIYVKAWTRLGTLRHLENLKAWLLTLARNSCLDYLRKERVKKLFIKDFRLDQANDAMATAVNPEHKLVLDEDRIRLKAAIRSLPEKLRQVIILKEYGEFSCQQISSLLGVKLGTIHSRLNRARKRIIKKVGGSLE
jgi:RNA polymerase sigma-70 factor (ECF subfamily)